MKYLFVPAFLLLPLAGCGATPTAIPMTAPAAIVRAQHVTPDQPTTAELAKVRQAIAARLDRNVPDDVVSVDAATLQVSPTPLGHLYTFRGTEQVFGWGARTYTIEGTYDTVTGAVKLTRQDLLEKLA